MLGGELDYVQAAMLAELYGVEDFDLLIELLVKIRDHGRDDR